MLFLLNAVLVWQTVLLVTDSAVTCVSLSVMLILDISWCMASDYVLLSAKVMHDVSSGTLITRTSLVD